MNDSKHLLAGLFLCPVFLFAGCAAKKPYRSDVSLPSAKAPVYRVSSQEESIVKTPALNSGDVTRSATAEEGVVETVTFDLETGEVLGARIGMNEAEARAELVRRGLAPVEKVEPPGHFLLQTRKRLGIIWRFRDNRTLTEIYTNQRVVELSNGLCVGDPVVRFDGVFGEPVKRRRLPSGVGEELIYPAGEFEIGAIKLDREPETVHAVTLRKSHLSD